jgi:hypothetical protein
MQRRTARRAWATDAPSAHRHHRMPAPRTTSWEHYHCPRHRGRRSGRRSSRIRSRRKAHHSSRGALSKSMLHPAPPALAAPTPPPMTHNHRSPPRRRHAHQPAAPPLVNRVGGGGCSAAHNRRWPGLQAAPSTLVCCFHLLLRVEALAPRRCHSRPPRLRLHRRSR